MSGSPLVVAIVAATYFGVAIGHIPGLKLNRAGIALLGAIAVMVCGRISTAQAVALINWPTIFLLFGFFVISAQLCLSGLYARLAETVARQLGRPARFLFIVMAVTAGLSAILNHDVVCLVFTPVVAAALLSRRLDPVPFLIALAIASNLGAAATLVGSPQNMMIGEVAHLGFGAYLLWSVIPTVVSLAAAYGLIWALARRRIEGADPRKAAKLPPQERPGLARTFPFDPGHTRKGLFILALVIALFFTPLPKEVIALVAAGIHLASRKYRTEELLGLVDWPLLLLFMSLFVVTGAFQAGDYGHTAAGWLGRHQTWSQSPLPLILATTVLSNLMSNAPAVMLLLKIIPATQPHSAFLLALANGSAGNLTLMGGVANLIVVQQARAQGVKISYGDYLRLGGPVAVVSLGILGLWAAATA